MEIWGQWRKEYLIKRCAKESAYKTLGIPFISLEGSFFNRSTKKVYKDLDDLMECYQIFSSNEKKDIVVYVKACGYWNFENTIKELQEITDRLGFRPSHDKLYEIGRADLARAISRNGGMYMIRDYIKNSNVPLVKPRGFWTMEEIIKQMQNIVGKTKAFPSRRIIKLAEKKEIADKGLLASLGKYSKQDILAKLHIPQHILDEYNEEPKEHYMRVKASMN